MARYIFNQDYDAEYSIPPNPEILIKRFNKNQYILASLSPYISDTTGKQMESVVTTLEGREPSFGMVGQIWLTIPMSVLTSYPEAKTTFLTPRNITIGVAIIVIVIIIIVFSNWGK